MALPNAGTALSMSMIRTELANTGTNNYRLSYAGSLTSSGTNSGSGYVPINRSSTSKPNDASPYQISEWYGYNHSASLRCPTGNVTTPTLGRYYVYYKVDVTGSTGAQTTITLQSPDNTLSHSIKCDIWDQYPFTNTGEYIIASPFFSRITYDTTQFSTTYNLSSFTTRSLYFVIQDNGVITTTYNNSGTGSTAVAACGVTNLTLYSNCSVMANGCQIYVDQKGDVPLTGTTFVQINNFYYSINSSTGKITSNATACGL